jgi:hypothetical protein
MQPTSKVTRHQSVATSSQQIRRVHEDPRAHQSIQTTLRGAHTPGYDMGAHLAASIPSLRRFGHLFRSADQPCRPTKGRCLWSSLFHVSTPHLMPRSVPGGRGPISGLKRPWHPPIYMRGGGKNHNIHQVQLQAFSLV